MPDGAPLAWIDSEDEVSDMTSGEGAGGSDVTTVLAVEGMHCQSCVVLIEETLVEDLGVVAASVDLDGARATVTYDPTRLSVADLCDAVVAAGYTAVPVPA